MAWPNLGGVHIADLFVAGVGAEASHLAVEKVIDPIVGKMVPGAATSIGWGHNILDLAEKTAAAFGLTYGTHKVAGPRWGRDVAYGTGGLIFASLIGDIAPGTAGVGASVKQSVSNITQQALGNMNAGSPATSGATPSAAPATAGALPAGGAGLIPAQQAAASGQPNVPTAVAANTAVGL